MRVTVQIDEDGELWATTQGYRDQGPEVVTPRLVTAVTSALQRLKAARSIVLPQTAGPVAAGPAVVVVPPRVAATATDEKPLALVTPPRRPVAPAALADVARAEQAARPRPVPPATDADVAELERKRIEVLQLLDDDELPEVIADQVGVSVRQIKAWDRGDK